MGFEYKRKFISVAEDCLVEEAEDPPAEVRGKPTIAAQEFSMFELKRFQHTMSDVRRAVLVGVDLIPVVLLILLTTGYLAARYVAADLGASTSNTLTPPKGGSRGRQRRRGLPKPFTSSAFSACHLTEKGEPLAKLKGTSRHRSIRSLERYVAPGPATLRAMTDKHDTNRR